MTVCHHAVRNSLKVNVVLAAPRGGIVRVDGHPFHDAIPDEPAQGLPVHRRGNFSTRLLRFNPVDIAYGARPTSGLRLSCLPR